MQYVSLAETLEFGIRAVCIYRDDIHQHTASLQAAIFLIIKLGDTQYSIYSIILLHSAFHAPLYLDIEAEASVLGPTQENSRGPGLEARADRVVLGPHSRSSRVKGESRRERLSPDCPANSQLLLGMLDGEWKSCPDRLRLLADNA